MRPTLCALLAVMLGAGAGCATPATPTRVPFNPQATTGDVHVRQNQQFEDIPVPYGFRLRRDRMFSYQGQAFRYGVFTYDGAWRGLETRHFYREQMPLHSWEYRSRRPIATRDGEFLTFTRGREIAEITIRQLPQRVRVDVTVRDRRYTDPMVLAEASRTLAQNPPAADDDGTGGPVAPFAVAPPASGFAPSFGETRGYAPSATPAGDDPFAPAAAAPGVVTPLRPADPAFTPLPPTGPGLPSGLGVQMLP